MDASPAYGSGQGQDVDFAFRNYSGKARDAVFNLAIEASYGLVLFIGRTGDRDLQREDAIRGESRLDILQTHKAADEQSRADQQDERQGEFRDDQQSTQLMPRDAQSGIAVASATSGLQRSIQVYLDGPPGGSESEQNSSEQRNAEGEKQDSAADADLIHSRDIAWLDGMHDMNAPGSDDESGGASHQGEQNAFGEQLPHQALPSRAERGADGNFFGARGGPRQQQIGHVGAGDQ